MPIAMGLGLGLTFPRYTGGGGVSSVLSSIHGPNDGPTGAEAYLEGWAAEWADGTPPTFDPDGDPQTITVSRQGFTTAGATTTYTDDYVITARVRQPYPNQASLSTATVALSDYVYSTDTIAGATNNCTLTSPKPVANWATPHRLVVGNTLTGEIQAYHRNARGGKQVACVVVTATDGTNTVSTTVTGTTVSGRTGDRYAVIVYPYSLDISSLTDSHLITLNAKVYPWIGAAASVLDSSAQSALREFSPRYFFKSTAKAASPPLAYVTSAGNDTTGVWSTTAATAAATPFLTVAGALNAVNNATRGTPATGGVVDGCEIRIGSGTFVLAGPSTARTQNVGALTITRDPAVARGSAIVSFGTSAFRPQFSSGLTSPLTTGALRLHDITVSRTGSSNFLGEASTRLELIWDDCDLDNGSQTTTWLSSADDYIYGLTITNIASATNPLGPSSTYQHRIVRGVSADVNFGQVDGWFITGSSFTRPGVLGRGSSTYSGAIFSYNLFSNPTASGGMLPPGASGDVNGCAIVQNVFEYTSATGATQFVVTADGASGNVSHILIFNNTLTGFGGAGRSNLFYDDGSTARYAKLHAVRGNIHCQVNTKGDVFVGTDGGGSPNPGAAPTRIMNWAFLYGVGSQGEFTQFIDAANSGFGGSFAQVYPGLGADYGTSLTVRNDPLFTSYQGTTSGPTAGAGGGDYSVAVNSPAKGMMASAALAFDLAGNARNATGDTAGAYA